MIVSYIRFSIIVLWIEEDPLSTIQHQARRFVLSYLSSSKYREPFRRGVLTCSFLDIATLRVGNAVRFKEVVRT